MARKPAQHRGTGPSSAKNQPKKITIGDGSIRDLVYFLMGGDVATKSGRKKVSSGDVRNEVQSLVRAQMQGNSPFVPDYTAREAEFDRVVNRNRSMVSQPVVRGEADIDRSKSPYTGTRGYSNPEGQRLVDRPNRSYSSPTAQNVPLMKANYDRRRMMFNQARDTQYENPIGPSMTEQPIPDAYNDGGGDPNYSLGVDTEGYFNMGGYVQPKKKKKKKKMYGGKMKKYAKGGGIRKPKYS